MGGEVSVSSEQRRQHLKTRVFKNSIIFRGRRARESENEMGKERKRGFHTNERKAAHFVRSQVCIITN
jgi:hypothetical protein